MKNLPRTRVLVLICTLALLAAGARCFAQEAPASTEAQPLHILVGKSVVINLQSRLTRVLASNPAVIETLVTSPTQLVVEAKEAGNSSLILWDESGNSRMLDVHVDLDLSGLRTAIQDAYPHDSIQVQAEQGRIILSGTVNSQAAVDDLLKMSGSYSKDIVSSLATVVTPLRQILLEVKFAEVDRTKLDQEGFNLFSTGATNTLGVIGTQQFGPVSGQSSGGGLSVGTAGTQLSLSSLLNLFLFRPDINLGMTLQDLEQKSILQILAEPNLLALDGQKASFLAGGEFPVPVVQGGASVGAVTIQFRPYGVKLDFTGHIGPDNTLRLQVAPEVSTLDYSNAVNISGFTVPALSTRRAETEVELKDGQSFGIAGLLDQRTQAQFSKLPGIGDIPILGQLFRSRSVTRSRTELMVIVTPYIVDPVRTGQQSTAPKMLFPNLNVPKYDSDVPGRKKTDSPTAPPVPKKEP